MNNFTSVTQTARQTSAKKQFYSTVYKDNGEGVKEDCIDKIFHKFYRVDYFRSREKGGTGLGLAICKDIVENHEGFIRAENLPDKGLWY